MTGVANDSVINFPLSLEELEAFSDLLHGRSSIRFSPDETWTAEKMMDLRTRVDAELCLLKAETIIPVEGWFGLPDMGIEKCPHGVPITHVCAVCLGSE